MRRLAVIGLMALLAATFLASGGQIEVAPAGDDRGQPEPNPAPAVSFETVEVIIDSGPRPLAAYQIEIAVAAGNVRFVGIEGGGHEIFAEPPYYDPAAMRSERVIIADFSTAARERLPLGRVRVATLHLQVRGDVRPSFRSRVEVAATTLGEEIEVGLVLQMGPKS